MPSNRLSPFIARLLGVALIGAVVVVAVAVGVGTNPAASPEPSSAPPTDVAAIPTVSTAPTEVATPYPPTPDATVSEPPAPTPTPVTTDTPTPTAQQGPVWRRAIDFPPDGAELTALLATDSGFLAGGTVDSRRCEDGVDGRIWTSADGVTWSIAGELPGTYIENIVAAGDVLYAFGTGGDNCDYSEKTQVWRSADGSHWERVATGFEGDDYVDTTGAAGDTLMALGESDDGYHQESVMWTSTDGVAWQRSTDGPVSAFGSELVGAGDIVVALDSYAAIPVWYSSDGGLTWRESPYRPSAWVQPYEGVAAHGAIVAIAAVCCALPDVEVGASIVSSDGASWVESHAFAEKPSAIVAIRDGFLAIGQRQNWVSADGLSWNLGPPLPEYDRRAYPIAASGSLGVLVLNEDVGWFASSTSLSAEVETGPPEPAEMPVLGVRYPVDMRYYCGDGEIDFGLRTWVPDPAFSEDYWPYGFFGEGERGWLTLVGPDELQWEGRSDTTVTLRPNARAIVNGPCA